MFLGSSGLPRNGRWSTPAGWCAENLIGDLHFPMRFSSDFPNELVPFLTYRDQKIMLLSAALPRACAPRSGSGSAPAPAAGFHLPSPPGNPWLPRKCLVARKLLGPCGLLVLDHVATHACEDSTQKAVPRAVSASKEFHLLEQQAPPDRVSCQTWFSRRPQPHPPDG